MAKNDSVMEVTSECGYTCGNYTIGARFDVTMPDSDHLFYDVVLLLYSEDFFYGHVFVEENPTSYELVMASPTLPNGRYFVETYALPVWVKDEVFQTGEIVTRNGNVYVSNVDDNMTDPFVGGDDWTLVSDEDMRDEISSIKDPAYNGLACFEIDEFEIDCDYDKYVAYQMHASKNCADLSVEIDFHSDISNIGFVYMAWLFDITDIGKPASELSVIDLTTASPALPLVSCDCVTDGNAYFGGLCDGSSYAALTMAVPEYSHGHMYSPGDIAYDSGVIWQVNPGLGHDTMSVPSDAEWIRIWPSPLYGCEEAYWAYWAQYVGNLSDYSYAYECVEFDCTPGYDASELDMSKSSVNSADASFALIRTNPAITGNILLTVNLAGDIWLNSIDANEELAKDQYKNKPVDVTRTHPANVYSFFDKGKTPPEIIFDVRTDVNPTVMTNKYEDQFDFSLYYSGIKYLNSKYYDEKFTYFAPLYLKKTIPEYFVIFKVNDPLNLPVDQLSRYDYSNQTDYIYEIFRRASIIKSFDLSEGTKIGKYLRSIINDPMFPDSPLSVNFTEDGMTTWNGISVMAGTWNSKGELLHDLYTDDDALKYFEEYVTLGYRRHGIMFPNIINMEFIFDDETSGDFDFNRYIGFYVNAVELEKFDIDINRYNANQQSFGNSPIFYDLIDRNSDSPRLVSNDAGVALPYEYNMVGLDYRDFGLFREKIFVNYVRDKNRVLHGLAVENPYVTTQFAGSPSINVLDTIRLADKSLDISCLFGSDDVFIQDKGVSPKTNGYASSYIRLSGKLSNYDRIRIYHDGGSDSDADGMFDDIIVYSQQSSPSYLPNPGDSYQYVYEGSPQQPDAYYVNGETLHGRTDPILSAIKACIDSFPDKTFETIVINDTIFLKSYAPSFANGGYGVRFYSPVAAEYGTVEIGGVNGSALVGKLVRFEGGTDTPHRLIMSANHSQKIRDNMSSLLVRTEGGWSPIISVARCSDSLDSFDLDTDSKKSSAYAEYFGKISVALGKPEQPDISDGTFLIKTMTRAEYGMLSFFNVKDFDCDFYSTKYNRYPYWEYYKHLTIPVGKNLLIPGVTYVIRTNGVPGSVIYDGVRIDIPFGLPSSYEASFVAVAGAESYSIPSDGGNPSVMYGYPQDYYVTHPEVQASSCQTALSPISYGSMFFDDNKDMSSFDGFFALRDISNRLDLSSNATNDLSEYYKRFTGDNIRSEYDFYRENFVKDFAFKSKLLPYSCKWGYLDGLDARDNEYRLNNHLFFGEHNFSPSQIKDIQDELQMTHEWYYIVANYPMLKDRAAIVANYCYMQEDIDVPTMISVSGEFERYFTHVPLFDSNGQWVEAGKSQQRYSVIRYNESVDHCETFFHGAKLVFRDVLRDSDGNIIYDDVTGKPKYANSRRFEDYKFTVLLRPVEEDLNDPSQPPLRMRFIEHSEFKFVLFLIEFAVGCSGNVNPYITAPITRGDIDWLYTLNSPNSRIDGDYRIEFDGGISDLTYSFLYGAKNKKFSWVADAFSTIRIPTLFSQNGFVIDRDYNKYRGLYYNYDSNMSVDIIEYGGDPLSEFIVAAEYFGDTVFNGYPLAVTKNSIDTGSCGTNFSYSVGGGVFSPSMDDLSAYKQIAGGRRHYENFMKRLSFASIVNYINEMGPFDDKRDGMVEYETYVSAGSVPVTRDFFAEVLQPTEIVKTSIIVPDTESVIPDKFRQIREIGFEFKKGSLQNGAVIYRYGGGYEPVFRNVFYFLSKYDFNYNPDMKTIFLANNVFATEMEKFGMIENFCHMKVADKKILALQDDPKFYPAYELLNEITIGRDTFVAMHSSWDYGFHKRYVAKDAFENVCGALRVKEDYTYFGKVLNLPFDTPLLDYQKPQPPMAYDSKISYEPVLMPDINSVDMEKYCVVYAKGAAKDEWVGYINMRNAMIHKFKKGGISAKFDEFLTPSVLSEIKNYIGYTNVDDYVTAYLTENVYDMYGIVDAYFYVKYDHSSVSSFSMEYHDDSVLANTDWSVTKDVEINKYSKHVLSFRFVLPLNSGATLSPAIKIKLI